MKNATNKFGTQDRMTECSVRVGGGAGRGSGPRLSGVVSFTFACLMALFSVAQAAQPAAVTVGPQRQVSPDGVEWREVAAAACQTSENEVVILSAKNNLNDPNNAGAITLNAGLTFFPFASFGMFGIDPWVVPELGTGRIWVGGVSATTGIKTNCRDQGSTVLCEQANIVVHNAGLTDKPFMGIGPSVGNPNVHSYHVLFDKSLLGCSSKLAIHSANSTTPNTPNWPIVRDAPTTPFNWPCVELNCNYQGWGALPVVLDNGHIVVASIDANPQNGGCYNENRPVVTWSTDGGVTWNPTNGIPIQLGINASPPIQAIKMWGTETQPGDTIFGVDGRKGAVTIAVDRRPTDFDTIYVAFAARRELTTATDGNSDIYISQVRQSAPGGPYIEVGNPLHLTDEMLGLTPHSFGPDQFVPAIAIDCTGGINLMYYDNRVEQTAPAQPDAGNPDRWVQVYYTRITGWPGGTPQVFSQVLTPTAFPVSAGAENLGDYHTMAFGGPTPRRLYPVYIAKKFVNGQWSGRTCFMNKVSINLCTADLNFNMVSDSGDIDVFGEAYADGDPVADLDENGLVTDDDLVVFEEAFEALSGQ